MSGCAQGPNGELLDAKDIEWHESESDDVPMAGPSVRPPAASLSASSPSAPSARPNAFDVLGKTPAIKVAGSRRSARSTKPSAKARDPDNATRLTASSVTKKRPNDNSGDLPVPSKRRATAIRVDSDTDMDSDTAAISATLDKTRRRKTAVSEDVERDDQDISGSDIDGEDVDEDDDDDDDDDDENGYAQAKALGDKDREARRTVHKRDRTADLKTIFVYDAEHKNRGTGVVEPGFWCSICKKAGRSEQESFFRGGVSTRRTHIKRFAKSHFPVYRERCEKRGIQMHERAIPEDEQDDEMVQTTLDGNLVPKAPPFSPAGLLEYIVELIVCEDEAFQLVDKGPFRRLLKYVRPSLKESDIPHRTKIRKEILEKAEKAIQTMQDKYKSIDGEFSMTLDTWTNNSITYLSVTGHYITAPPDKPQDWELKNDQLAFTALEGNHGGKNIAKFLVHTVERYGIKDKVGWVTADNASNNDTAVKALGKAIDASGKQWDPEERRIMCLEHAIHLGAKHFTQAISPTLRQPLLKKIKKAFNKARVGDNEDNIDLDALDKELSELGLDDEAEGLQGEKDDEVEEGEEFDIGDAVGKALALVAQIRKSPQAQAYFKQTCKEVQVPVLQLLLWIRTRWASLYNFLARLLEVRKAVDRFTRLADVTDAVPKLKDKWYSDFALTDKEWEHLGLVHEVLQETADAHQSFSSVSSPTLWRAIPVLEYLQDNWERMAGDKKFSSLKDAIKDGLKNLGKWYRKTDTSGAYFIAHVLDPNCKMAYVEDKWDKEWVDAAKSRLESEFDRYHREPSAPSETPDAAQAPRTNVGYGHSWIRAAVKAREDAKRANGGPREELQLYLSSPVEEVDDVVLWWGHHSTQYPTLARMARDYLAIQGSAVASERSFSGGGLTGTARRNRLTSRIFEALQILKSAYKNGHISASEEVLNMLQDLAIESEDESEEGEDVEF